MKDKEKSKLLLGLIAVLIGVIAVVNIVSTPLNKRIGLLHEEKKEMKALQSDASPVLEERNRLKKEESRLSDRIVDIKETAGGNTATKEEFLLYLGEETQKNGVKLVGFSNGGMSKTGGIYKQTFDFELRGTRKNLNSVLSRISDMGIKTSYLSVSFRQNMDYDYLIRHFDRITAFPWFSEKEDEEEETGENKTDSIVNEQTELNVERGNEPAYTEPIKIPSIPEPVTPKPQEPSVPDNKTEYFEEGIDEYLEPTVLKNGIYTGMVLLTNKSEYSHVNKIYTDPSNPNEMRLAVTVQFIMFNAPQSSTSFMRKQGDDNAVL